MSHVGAANSRITPSSKTYNIIFRSTAVAIITTALKLVLKRSHISPTTKDTFHALPTYFSIDTDPVKIGDILQPSVQIETYNVMRFFMTYKIDSSRNLLYNMRDV